MTAAAAMKTRGPPLEIASAPWRSRTVAYWLTTGVAAVAFLVPGAANLARVPHIAEDMAHLGYPPYFLTVLGTWKVLGAIVIVAPRFRRLKEWAYAGMIFDLTGAAVSRAATGGGAAMITVPLVIAGVVLTSWALRPKARAIDLTRGACPSP